MVGDKFRGSIIEIFRVSSFVIGVERFVYFFVLYLFVCNFD